MNLEIIDTAILEEIEAFSVQIARESGHILLEHFNKPLEVNYKGKNDTDPVTEADRNSEEYLKQAIMEKFPEHNIICEEGGISSQNSSPFTWVLDPLDGTANFINGLPFFAVSVGVLWNNQPVVGSIYVPVSPMTAEGVYHAFHGNGAYFDDKKITVAAEQTKQPLAEMPPQFGKQFRLLGKSRKESYEIRNLGSIAFELALTASGVFQYALFMRPKLWDVLAGTVLVTEAGGVVFTYGTKGKKWNSHHEFDVQDTEIKTQLEDFQNWSSPLIAGTSDAVDMVVKDIRFRRSPFNWMNNLRPAKKKTSK
ncbi:MAG: inositol monophosphatase [Dehalococcoidales bacterium]|nr:MAG: inositol monophosphatase [Dehalococcoidales bacterium]